MQNSRTYVLLLHKKILTSSDPVLRHAIVRPPVLLLNRPYLQHVAPVDRSPGRQNGVVLPPPRDARRGIAARVALHRHRLALRHDQGARRVVGDHRRFADLQLHLGRDDVRRRYEDLALVEAGVRLLDVLDLEGVGGAGLRGEGEGSLKKYPRLAVTLLPSGHTYYVVSEGKARVVQDEGAARADRQVGGGRGRVAPHPQHRILLSVLHRALQLDRATDVLDLLLRYVRDRR